MDIEDFRRHAMRKEDYIPIIEESARLGEGPPELAARLVALVDRRAMLAHNSVTPAAPKPRRSKFQIRLSPEERSEVHRLYSLVVARNRRPPKEGEWTIDKIAAYIGCHRVTVVKVGQEEMAKAAKLERSKAVIGESSKS